MPAILPTPPQPGWLHVCPACGRWLALRFLEEVADPVMGRLRVYRCKYCGRASAFADRYPPGSLGATRR